jgi:succinate dehydrogenase/fumarate reductase iron-sulfur protein
MNIDGTNTLACTKACADVRGDVKIYPLPHLPVIKDLVPDLTGFYAQYAAIQPWLQARTPPPPDGERLQSKEEQRRIDEPSACILCACCSTALPELLVERGSLPRPRDTPAGVSVARGLPRRSGRESGSTRSRIRSGCIAATRS